MSLRNYFLIPQDATGYVDEDPVTGDIAALIAAFDAATETPGEQTRYLYTESGRNGKRPIASKQMDGAEWALLVPELANIMYLTDNS